MKAGDPWIPCPLVFFLRRAERASANDRQIPKRHRLRFMRRTIQVEKLVAGNANDQGQLTKPLDELQAVHGKRPATVLADADYCNEADLEELEARGVDGYVALGRGGRCQVAVDARRYPVRACMARKMATKAGRTQYVERKWLAEAPIGWIKQALGFRRFSLRGLDKVRGEWDLVCLALNIKRMGGCLAAA